MKFLRIFTLLCLTLTMPAAAQDVPDDASLIRLSEEFFGTKFLSTRVFDMRTDVRNLRRDEHWVSLTDIPWLRELIDSDPYLHPTVIKISFKATPMLDTWPSVSPDEQYPLTENIPATFVVEGFQTRSNHPSNRMLLLLPDKDPYDFHVLCLGADVEVQAGCSVVSAYPPDPRIYMSAFVFSAKPPFNFREIAHRMREIAYCLDVTDQLAAEGRSQEREVDADLPLPVMKGCEPELSS